MNNNPEQQACDFCQCPTYEVKSSSKFAEYRRCTNCKYPRIVWKDKAHGMIDPSRFGGVAK